MRFLQYTPLTNNMKASMKAAASWLLIISVSCFDTSTASDNRYITFTVNYGEGFNLRRDVYIRVVTLVLALRRETDLNWILVLPPWPRLYHWKSQIRQNWLPWSQFFELTELSAVVPCVEFSYYLDTEGYIIEEVLQLQDLKDPFVDNKYVETAEEGECSNKDVHWKPVFGNDRVKVGAGTCVSAQGRVSVLKTFLKERDAKRKSMVYSWTLREAGNHFMIKNLGYNPGKGTGRRPPPDRGGKYIGAHLRRKDFLYSHKDIVPSLKGLVSQLNILMREQNLTMVFIATDASMDDEFQRALNSLNGEMYRYVPTSEELETYGDGGVAIIDQWILSHAQYFIGTADSTFSYRVREDRQLMGFTVDNTFNDFCGSSHNDHDPHSCPKPSKWLLVNNDDQNINSFKTEL